ncbi:MAG: pyridoxal phosphate-dependent aminotransferase [Rhodothermales bacterium]|nr:pyridoxal phosphate-dependent aminotransferase [Rhodothermales bacterium]MBO6781364.1 pyridoxal phosphate-dependent aminotransferase [Rhodothermales bacterium]
MKPLSDRTSRLGQSDIRAISLLIREHGGINLGQGICDMPTPDPIKEAAKQAIDGDRSIYSHYAGIESLRELVVQKARDFNRLPITGTREVMVSAGSTGAFMCAMLTMLDQGDEVILFEPFYGYHRNMLALLGIDMRFVKTTAPNWDIDFEALEAAISPRTKAVLVNTPGNPHGKVWSRAELEQLTDLLERHDLYALTDEIYEHMVYDGREHVSLGSIEGAWERTLTISGFSKTFNMTGWRLGYAMGPEHLIAPMGLINDLVYICAPTPLQHGVAAGLRMPEAYFTEMLADYTVKRDMMCTALEEAGFRANRPQGAYYVLADFTPLQGRFEGFSHDQEAARTLVSEAGVGAVAGRSFFRDPVDGAGFLRFCYAKEFDELQRACEQLVDAFA